MPLIERLEAFGKSLDAPLPPLIQGPGEHRDDLGQLETERTGEGERRDSHREHEPQGRHPPPSKRLWVEVLLRGSRKVAVRSRSAALE